MASKSIIFSAAFLALVSLVAGRALEEVELVRDPSLVHGVRTVPSILVPYGVSGVVGERNPVVVQRPVRGAPIISSEGYLLSSGYGHPQLVTGNVGSGRSDVPIVGRPGSGSGLGLGLGGNLPVSELGRQYQSGVVPVQLNSGDQQGYVPLPFYPGNVPLNPVNPVNLGYNSGYMPYYYTYVAGYAPQPIIV